MDSIQYIWQRVAEDFLPYGVDVTTQDPGIEGLRKLEHRRCGLRAAGGHLADQLVQHQRRRRVAYIGSFNWNTDTPCFVFTAQLRRNEKYIAEAPSHEDRPHAGPVPRRRHAAA